MTTVDVGVDVDVDDAIVNKFPKIEMRADHYSEW